MTVNYFKTDNGGHNFRIEFVIMLFRKINTESPQPCLYTCECLHTNTD